MLKRIAHLAFCLALFALIAPAQAHAYLDPGTGSLLLQGLAAGFVAVLAFWGRLRKTFSAYLNRKKEQ